MFGGAAAAKKIVAYMKEMVVRSDRTEYEPALGEEIVQLRAELARLRVIEKEHGEMRATLRAIVEYLPTSPGQDSILCRTQGMAAIILSRLTPPAKAEGKSDNDLPDDEFQRKYSNPHGWPKDGAAP